MPYLMGKYYLNLPGVVASRIQSQLSPDSTKIEYKIEELENQLKDSSRQSDNEMMKYFRDYINFLKSYKENKYSYAEIERLIGENSIVESGDDGEVDAIRFVNNIKEGKLIINSKIANEEIFIRLTTPKEQKSETEKKKAMNSIPEKDGYEIVYKPYGEKGKGFYYIKKEKEGKFLQINSKLKVADIADKLKINSKLIVDINGNIKKIY